MNKIKMKENLQLVLCFQVKNEPPYIHMGWKKVLQPMWDICEYELVGAPTSSCSNLPHMGWKTSFHPMWLGGKNSEIKISSPKPSYIYIGCMEILLPKWDIGEHELVGAPN